MKTLKIYLLLIIFTIFGSIFTPTAFAESVNLGIYPPVFQATTTPPADISTPLSLYNFLDTPLELKIVTKPFTQNAGERGEVIFLSDNPTEQFIKKNVRILNNKTEISTITLAAKEIKELTLKITVPKGQSRSDYYFSVIFLSTNKGTNNLNLSSSLGGIATNVLISVGPKGPTNGEIKQFSTPFFVQGGPVPFTLKLANLSDHFIAPKGKIIIKNMFGQTVGKVDLLPVNILSNTTRFIPDYQSYLSSLKNKVKFDSKTAFWNEKFLLGLYTASLTISLSDSGPEFKKDIYFFALPIEAILAIIILIFIVFKIRERIKNRLNS